MNVLSDSESSDSDAGRRFKTESTRAREDYSIKKRNDGSSGGGSRRDIRHYRSSRSRSKSMSRSRNRSRSRERYPRKRSRSRERSHRKYDRYENVDKSSKRHESAQSKQQNDREKEKDRTRDKDRDRERDRERERSTHQSSSSKLNDKFKSSSSQKKPHSKSSTSEEKSSSKTKSLSSDAAIESSEKHKKHKKEKEKNRDEQRSNKSTEYEHRRNNDKQLDLTSVESTPKRSVDDRQSPKKNGNQESGAEDIPMCGPSLPPHMLKSDEKMEVDVPKLPSTSVEKTYGPTLPRDFVAISESVSYNEAKDNLANEDISESDDEELIGPVLDHIANKSEAYLELEKRALELKLAKLNEREKKDDSIRGREEWMLELPELRKVTDLGLSARQFRTKERDEIKDRSQWTETPKDREEKSKRKPSTHDDVVKMRHENTERMYRERRDAEQEDAVRKHKKKHKRDESLLEMHQKKMKKKTQEKNEPVERRPFSRDTDLKVNRFDEAQKKSVLKKAQLLDTRFNSGQSKYL